MKNFLILISAILVTLVSFGQPLDESVPRDGVKVIARPLQDSIMLRWAPTSAVTWHYGNKYGYIIERITVLRDGKVVSNPASKILTRQPLKPLPMEKWEIVVDTSQYGAVVAQALYGEDFEVTGGQSSDMIGIYNKSRELESRFSFSVFAADQAYWLAKISGLGFTDKDINKNEKYLYRIYIPSDPSVLKADTAFAYVGVMDFEELPAPIDLNARFEDRYAMLSWNSEVFEGIYSSYLVERSEDNKTYKLISSVPHVNTFEGDRPKTPYSFRSDSLPENNKRFYYRVRGINAFGEVGPPSDTISGIGRKLLASTPAIFKAESPDNKTMHIEWSFMPQANEEIESFSLFRSRYDRGPYQEIVREIAPEERWVADTEAKTDNYYKIVAYGKYGEEATSFPFYAQLVDSIPPSIPLEFKGKIDTTGIVTLNWRRNKDSDLLGYRVYRSNFEEDEFIQITSSPVMREEFTDTLNLNTLTETIYYKVAAVDQRFNVSDLSKSLLLKKPDKIPPVAPILKNLEPSSAGILVSWIPSSSADVNKHVLYRSEGKNDWTVVKTIYLPDSINSFADESIMAGKTYLYTVVAVDDDGLESEPAKPIAGKKTDWGVRPAIEKLEVSADKQLRQITLSWFYELPDVEKYVIYRGVEEDQVRIYTSVPASSNLFIDKKLTVSTKYTYLIKAVFTNGAESALSREIEVKY